MTVVIVIVFINYHYLSIIDLIIIITIRIIIITIINTIILLLSSVLLLLCGIMETSIINIFIVIYKN